MDDMKIEKYASYKDSGTKWLGGIPTHWEVIRIKYLFKEINERSKNGDEDLLSVSQYTGVTKTKEQIEIGDLLTNAATLEGYKKVKRGDLVSNIMLAWNGSLGFSEVDGITSPAYSIYRLLGNNDRRYFHYLLRTELYKSEFKRNSSGVIESRLRLYTDDFFRILSILPPKEEQTAIAQFLDRKTAQIDKAIAQKERLIELLKERRQILIHKAVTKGLNWDLPDEGINGLTDNANPKIPKSKKSKFRHSGVEWIGEIPEHWEVKRLKYCLIGKLKYGANESGVQYDVNLPRYVRITDFGHDGKLSEDSKLSLTWKQGGDYLLKDGDILFARSGATVGKTYQFKKSMSTEENYCYAGYLIKAEPNEQIVLSDFLYLYTNSSLFNRWKDGVFNKATIENIGADKYSQLCVIIPHIEEQKQILERFNRDSKRFDSAISIKEQEIEKLKEYKATLINSAVTGKIKVV